MGKAALAARGLSPIKPGTGMPRLRQKNETPRTQRPPRVGAFMTAEEVAKDIIDAALKVLSAWGPGLLDSASQACLAHDLQRRYHRVECEVGVPPKFEGVLIGVGYRIDMRIDFSWRAWRSWRFVLPAAGAALVICSLPIPRDGSLLPEHKSFQQGHSRILRILRNSIWLNHIHGPSSKPILN